MQPSGYAIDTRHVGASSFRHSRKISRSSPSRDEWKQTFSFTTAVSIGCGASGTVFIIDSTWVIKVFGRDAEGQLHLAREKEIFDKLQSQAASEYIIHCKEQWASGLVLERLDTTLRALLKRFSQHDLEAQHPSALTWSLECCRGFALLHDNDIIHGDIGCQNVMISTSGHAKLCDFAGSKIGHKDAWVAYEVRSQHPLYSGQQPSITTDIFAIGSLLFEIWTARPPYAAEPDLVVKKKFRAGEFPIDSIKNPSIKEVIQKCWSEKYNKVSDICEGLELIKSSL
jgi:serine/threonine protein kinase